MPDGTGKAQTRFTATTPCPTCNEPVTLSWAMWFGDDPAVFAADATVTHVCDPAKYLETEYGAAHLEAAVRNWS